MAIVSGDIVGYSRLIATDEEAAVHLLTERRHEVEEQVGLHGGELFDFTGDNFLAGFSTAQSAVRFAIDLQAQIAEGNATLPNDRRMEFRLGVHQGEVRVEDGRVFGTGVNIAARLESIGEPGGVNISAAVCEQIQGRLDIKTTDLGEKTVKNIPNPVRVYQLVLGGAVPPSVGSSTQRRRIPLRFAAAAVGLLLLGAVSVFVARSPTDDVLAPASATANVPASPAVARDQPDVPDFPDKPSIVVLPFSNMSADPEQEYFADGITEDLTTDLAKIPRLFVIARNSAFTYKGRAVDVQQVGRELGVRYLLEGSVRKLGDRVRINAQLIDTTTGFHIWGGRYDGEFAELFDLQAEIGAKILDAMEVEISEAEMARVADAPIANASAYEFLLKGRVLTRTLLPETVVEGRALVQRAIELEPRYADAHAQLCQSYLAEYAGWNHDLAVLDLAFEAAQRALALDPRGTESQAAMGSYHVVRGEPGEGLPYLERAADASASSFVARSVLGVAQVQVGLLDEGIRNLETAIRLNPRAIDITWTALGYARYSQGDVDEGVKLWERARAASPDAIPDRLALIGHYQAAGDDARAREIAGEILAAHPDYSAERAADFFTRQRVYPEEASGLLLSSLRRAGLP